MVVFSFVGYCYWFIMIYILFIVGMVVVLCLIWIVFNFGKFDCFGIFGDCVSENLLIVFIIWFMSCKVLVDRKLLNLYCLVLMVGIFF